MFDNATSRSVYAEDALRVTNMSKGEGTSLLALLEQSFPNQYELYYVHL